MTSTKMYYYTKVMSDLFLSTAHSGGGTFNTMTNVDDFWKVREVLQYTGVYILVISYIRLIYG